MRPTPLKYTLPLFVVAVVVVLTTDFSIRRPIPDNTLGDVMIVGFSMVWLALVVLILVRLARHR